MKYCKNRSFIAQNYLNNLAQCTNFMSARLGLESKWAMGSQSVCCRLVCLSDTQLTHTCLGKPKPTNRWKALKIFYDLSLPRNYIASFGILGKEDLGARLIHRGSRWIAE